MQRIDEWKNALSCLSASTESCSLKKKKVCCFPLENAIGRKCLSLLPIKLLDLDYKLMTCVTLFNLMAFRNVTRSRVKTVP